MRIMAAEITIIMMGKYQRKAATQPLQIVGFLATDLELPRHHPPVG